MPGVGSAAEPRGAGGATSGEGVVRGIACAGDAEGGIRTGGAGGRNREGTGVGVVTDSTSFLSGLSSGRKCSTRL